MSNDLLARIKRNIRTLIWFGRLVWRPWHGGPITISEARGRSEIAGMIA